MYLVRQINKYYKTLNRFISVESYFCLVRQLTLDQSSTTDFKMDVQPTIIDNTASGGIDVYAGNKDIGIGIRHDRIGVDVGRNYKDNEMEYRLRWEAIKFK